MRARTAVAVVVLALVQLLLVGFAVAPRLSAYALGEEYLLRVAPLDPIDPFRGAYVALTYPDLPTDRELPQGTVYLPLVADGPVHTVGAPTVERPGSAPYVSCESDGWGLDCGIDSFFADQDEATRLESLVADGAVATVRVDDRGNAVVVAISPAP